MINYQKHIKPFEDSHTDAEIAVYCNTLCSRPINCSELRTLCAGASVISVNSEQKYVGPLVDFLFSSNLPTSPVNLQMLGRWFFQHVWMDQAASLTLDGSSSIPGADGFTVVHGFGVLTKTAGDANPAFADLIKAMVNIAGGFVYEDSLTEIDVAQSRNEYAAKIAIESLRRAASQAGNVVWNQFMTAVEAWDGTGGAPTLSLNA